MKSKQSKISITSKSLNTFKEERKKNESPVNQKRFGPTEEKVRRRKSILFVEDPNNRMNTWKNSLRKEAQPRNCFNSKNINYFRSLAY